MMAYYCCGCKRKRFHFRPSSSSFIIILLMMTSLLLMVEASHHQTTRLTTTSSSATTTTTTAAAAATTTAWIVAVSPYYTRNKSMTRHCCTTIQRSMRRMMNLNSMSSSSVSSSSSSSVSSVSLPPRPPQQQQQGELWIGTQQQQRIQRVMAPMVASSDYAFRRLVEVNGGVDMTFTQMLNVHNLLFHSIFRRHHLDFPPPPLQQQQQLLLNHDLLTKSQQDCIQGMILPPSQNEQQQQQQQYQRKPLIVQLAGHDVDLMKQAFSLLVQEENNCDFDGIDINLGCPQGIARRGRYGAFLIEHELSLTLKLLHGLRRHVPSPYTLSCKIRLPCSLQPRDVTDRILRLQDQGVDFITVHGRTYKENKTNTGPCHVDLLRVAVESAAKNNNLPIIVNGGIETHDDVLRLQRETGAAAIMSSEALLETPNIFIKDSSLLSPHEFFQQQMHLAHEYIHLCTTYPPLPGVLGQHGSFSIVKGHLFKMLYRYLHQQVDLRDDLKCSTRLVHVLPILQKLQQRYSSVEDCNACPSSAANSSWYRRHWNNANTTKNRIHPQGARPNHDHDPTTIGCSSSSSLYLTVDQRKEEMKKRIAKLRYDRLAKKEQQATLANST